MNNSQSPPPRIRVGDRVSYSIPAPTLEKPDSVEWRFGVVKAIAPDGVAAVDIGLAGQPIVRLEDLRSPF